MRAHRLVSLSAGLLLVGSSAAISCKKSEAPPAQKVAPQLVESAKAPTAVASPAKAGAAPASAHPRVEAGHHADSPKVTHKGEHSALAILSVVLKDNAHFAKNKPAGYFKHFAEKQHPRATVVACADSRFHEHALDREPDDDLFVIRNIGNQVDSTPGSVKYGVRHLHTPLLLIVGHVRCGAIRAVMEDYGDEHASIRRELDGLHTSIFRTKASGTMHEKWLQYTVGNVTQQVHNALVEYDREVKAGKLQVVGTVYDFMNELGEGRGRLVIVNVNGEADRKKITAHPLVVAARKKAGL